MKKYYFTKTYIGESGRFFKKILRLFVFATIFGSENISAMEVNRFEEMALLEKYAKYVRKVEGGYKVSCKNQEYSLLKNTITQEQMEIKKHSIAEVAEYEGGVTEYVFDDYIDKIDYMGFWVYYYEGSGYEMVSLKNCGSFMSDSKPHISPDGKRMMVLNDSEYSNGDLDIFEVNLKAAIPPDVMTKTKSFNDLVVTFHSWINSSNVRLEDYYSGGEKDKKLENFILHYDDNSKDWVLQKTSKAFEKSLSVDNKNIDQKRVDELESDIKVVTKILKNDPDNIKFVSPEIRSNKDVIMSVISKTGNGSYFQYASDELRDNEEVAKVVVGISAYAFQYLSERLRDNRDIALDVVKRNGYELTFVSKRLKDDKELVRFAAIQYPGILSKLSKKFREDDEFMRSIIEANGKANGDAIGLSSEKLKDDKFLAIKAFESSDSVAILQSLSERLRDDEDVVEAAVKKNQAYLQYASDRIRGDKKSALKLVSICSYPHMCVKYLSEKIQQDQDILDLVKGRQRKY